MTSYNQPITVHHTSISKYHIIQVPANKHISQSILNHSQPYKSTFKILKTSFYFSLRVIKPANNVTYKHMIKSQCSSICRKSAQSPALKNCNPSANSLWMKQVRKQKWKWNASKRKRNISKRNTKRNRK